MLARLTPVRMKASGAVYWIARCMDDVQSPHASGLSEYALMDQSGVVGSAFETQFEVLCSLKPGTPDVTLSNGTRIIHLREPNGSQTAKVDEYVHRGMSRAELAEYEQIRTEMATSRKSARKRQIA